MDLESKLEIFYQYDCSKHATLKREGIMIEGICDERTRGYQNQGWGAQMVNLGSGISYIAGGNLALPLDKSPNDLGKFFRNRILPMVENIQAAYGFFSMIYNSIPFEQIEAEIEMDQDKEDLSPLFDTRERIHKMGSAILAILSLARRKGYAKIDDDPIYTKNYPIIHDFSLHTQDYRLKMRELEKRKADLSTQ